jgi:hypothetical protein
MSMVFSFPIITYATSNKKKLKSNGKGRKQKGGRRRNFF